MSKILSVELVSLLIRARWTPCCLRKWKKSSKTASLEAPGVREDVSKMFNVRLPEPYLLKLKYIAEHTPDSMQQFCLDVLLPAIDAKASELTKQS
ncbi:MAG: hypothetical protein R3F37_16550 [Candidatus Competibacteraceae bacterium]